MEPTATNTGCPTFVQRVNQVDTSDASTTSVTVVTDASTTSFSLSVTSADSTVDRTYQYFEYVAAAALPDD